MRMDQFTVKAQEALASAQTDAERSDHPEVSPEHLLKALLSQEGGVVPSALGKLGAKEAVPAITKRLEDRDRKVRRAALEALMQLGAAAPLAHLLTDPHPGVRVSAASWLCRNGSREGVPALLEESDGLVFLNALRRPDAWKRLLERVSIADLAAHSREARNVGARRGRGAIRSADAPTQRTAVVLS